MTRRILLLIITLAIASCAMGEQQPTKGEIEQSLAFQLPSFVSLSSFSIEAMQNMGTQVDPEWATRFRASIELKTDTFAPDGEEPSVAFVRPVNRKGDTQEIFGKSASSLYMGSWRTSFRFDGQPIESLGQPASAFGPKKVIERGSKEESAYFAEKAETEKREIVERADKARLEAEARIKMLNDAPNLLVGSWRDENSLCVRHANGSIVVKLDREAEKRGTWSVDGDIVIDVFPDETWRTKIISINQSTFVSECNNTPWTAKRIK